MLNRLLALRLAIECFLSLPGQKDPTNYKMVDMEWFVLQEFEVILDVDVPHSLSLFVYAERVSSFRYLTASFRAFHDRMGEAL